MNEEKRIFAHALLVPEDVCREDCKVIKFTAVSADGKRFCYEPDLNDYCRDGWQMWDAFAAFCKECGLTKMCGGVCFLPCGKSYVIRALQSVQHGKLL